MDLSSQSTERRGIVSTFIRHPNAANLLMVLLVLFGLYGLAKINTQFFPTMVTDRINISISWSGASAEDVEQNILAIAEPSVRYVEGVKEMNSYAREGAATISLEFTEGYDIEKGLSDVEKAINGLTNLPEDSGDPSISTSTFFDNVASISIGGNVPESVLRDWANRIRIDLIERGIDSVEFTGMRDAQVLVEVPERQLRRLDMTVSDVASAISANSRDVPSGNLDGAVKRQLRTVGAVNTARGIEDIEIASYATGEKITVGDIATVEDGFVESDIRGMSRGVNAIEIDVQSTPTADTLTVNTILQDYIAEIRPQLPDTLELQVYQVRADALNDRIMLLVNNGISGLVLVLVILFVFLDFRIAFWVAAGIPVAMLATIGIIYLMGETINMISLFALIMMLGIIVDDAIVVGEHTDTRLSMGDDAVTAAENGVGQMFTPVLAALTTTMASFGPLMLITGMIGQMMEVLPVVVIAVGLASLVECFFILPGHLSHSLASRRPARWSWWRVFILALIASLAAVAVITRMTGTETFLSSLGLTGLAASANAPLVVSVSVALVALSLAVLVEFALSILRRRSGAEEAGEPSRFRRGFDAGFDWFRNGPFDAMLRLAYRWRYVTISVALGLFLVVARGLVAGEHVGFIFFDSPETDNISANVTMHPGTPDDITLAAVRDYEDALRKAETELTGGSGEKLIEAVFITIGQSGRATGDNLARIGVQLVNSERRSVRTPDIVRAWQQNAPDNPDVSAFAVRQSRGGPSGADVDLELSGPSVAVLKQAALEATDIIAAISGVSGVEDDLPYGKPELVMELTPRGRALGFTLESAGQQIRNSVEGIVPRRFARGEDEVAIRVVQTTEETGMAALRSMMLKSPSGNFVPLTEIVTLSEQQGVAAIQRKNGKTTISVTGDIDAALNSTDGVIERLTASGSLETLARKYDIEYAFGGRKQEQEDAFHDLMIGTAIALSVIYIILAWVFGSYFKPVAVMLIIPFGVVGAIFGHYLLGFNLTVMSLIGILGLSGILVNDSIILVSRMQERLATGEGVDEAAIGASRDRLRAVLLTSLTTIGGLVPLLFEASVQAQFLKPMAITMVFGLSTATLLVLFLVPVFVGIGHDIRDAFVYLYGERKTNARIAPAE